MIKMRSHTKLRDFFGDAGHIRLDRGGLDYISNGNAFKWGSTSDMSKHYECVADLESLRIVVWQNV